MQVKQGEPAVAGGAQQDLDFLLVEQHGMVSARLNELGFEVKQMLLFQVVADHLKILQRHHASPFFDLIEIRVIHPLADFMTDNRFRIF